MRIPCSVMMVVWCPPDWIDALPALGYNAAEAASACINLGTGREGFFERWDAPRQLMVEATMPSSLLGDAPIYERIYAVASQIPHGRVATYGQIASIVGECSARMVGYAMAALPPDNTVPWQRVINRLGKISLRASGTGSARQRQLLEAEGVCFDGQGRVDFDEVGWPGPDWEWLEAVGMGPSQPSGSSNSGSCSNQSELDSLW